MTQHNGRSDPSALRFDDPWYDTLASGWGEWDGGQPEPDMPPAPAERACSNAPAAPVTPAAPATPVTPPVAQVTSAASMATTSATAEVYLTVHRSEAFQEVRRRHRRFVFPAAVAFLVWYLGYIITATAAPGLMGRPVGQGPVNVGMLAGLGQFATTALLTWAYAWNAGRRRDRAALDLRWETQLRTREAAR